MGDHQAHLGMLCVQFQLEMTSRPLADSTALGNNTAAPPEFVVGAGARKRLEDSLEQNQRVAVPEDVSSQVGDDGGGEHAPSWWQNQQQHLDSGAFHLRDKGVGVPVVSIHCPTDSPSLSERRERKESEGLGDGPAIGRHQLAVISDLIDKGRRLRDSMVQSVLESRPNPSHSHGLGMGLDQNETETER